MSIVIISIFIISVIIYLSFDNLNLFQSVQIKKNLKIDQNNNIAIIQFLTQNVSRVEKDYTNVPENFISSRYNVIGSIIQGSYAKMIYNFPLINGKISSFKMDLKPAEISILVDDFGVNSPFISDNDSGIKYVIPQPNSAEFNTFLSELENGCWHIDESGQLSAHYEKLVKNHQNFCIEIAHHIHKELQDHQFDTYFNRVQAALNFVQHIPYGVPSFDKKNFHYFGLALPPESFVLNYSDCDSKSIFFASILAHLINPKNIVLVDCITSEPHMMVAVKGININTGQHIESEGNNYLLLETTTPCVIGERHWENFELKKIIKLDGQ